MMSLNTMKENNDLVSTLISQLIETENTEHTASKG